MSRKSTEIWTFLLSRRKFYSGWPVSHLKLTIQLDLLVELDQMYKAAVTSPSAAA